MPSNKVAQAYELEETLRDASVLGAVFSIGGITIRAMTLRDLLALTASRNAIVTRGVPTMTDLYRFVWFLSEGFIVPQTRWQKWTANRRIQRIIRQLKHAATAWSDLREYLDIMFMDAPASGGSSRPSSTSFCVSVGDFLAEEYGWTHEVIMAMPLQIVYQYIRRIQARRDPSSPVFSKFSDKAKAEVLREMEAA